jgi:alkylation response protein AidB-like acyl-CoA dehydrogenase
MTTIEATTGPDALEALFGDPTEDGPLGNAAILASDERGELLAAGERALHEYGFNAEFVPEALGGRFRTAEGLVQTARAVFRRDSALGIGYGVTSLIAAVPVWTSGRPHEQERLARLLLAGRRASACYTELPHGADFTRTELTARTVDDRLLLNGRKDLVNNVTRADAVLVFARTDDRPGSRSHSYVLAETAALPADRVSFGPRYHATGVRGCLLGGVEFRDCPIPTDSVVGELGGGMETALRAFQATRAVLPGMMVGVLDSQIRTVARFSLARRLYGRAVADLPQTRAVLAGAFLDLLIADSLAGVAARALHLLPRQTHVLGAAVKYLVPTLLQDASYQLSILLGARCYLREGEYAIFQKHMRDLPVVMLAHASSAVSLASIVPQLAVLARKAWDGAAQPAEELFRLGEPLPALDFSRLALPGHGEDDLCSWLRAAGRELAGEPELAQLCAAFVAELDYLRERCRQIPPKDRTVVAGRASFTLATRYTVVLAAAACLGVWRHAPAGAFHGDPAWVIGALRRLADRLGRRSGSRRPGESADNDRRLCAELLERLDGARSLDLADRRLAG